MKTPFPNLGGSIISRFPAEKTPEAMDKSIETITFWKVTMVTR